MRAYKRMVIMYVLLAVLGIFMIVKAEKLSDTPAVITVIGLFFMIIAIGKVILLKQAMKDDKEKNSN